MRALALLLVIGFHCNLIGMGWIGVQLFFVLSGFLITRVLCIQRQQSQDIWTYWKTFLLKRARRILPAFWVYLALALFIASVFFADAPASQNAQKDWLWSALFAYNWRSTMTGTGSTYLLTHTWSLAVEEQFYLLWPGLILLLPLTPRWNTPVRWLLLLILLAPVLRAMSPIVFSFIPQIDPNNLAHAVAMSVFSHIDAFAVGALIHFLPDPLSNKQSKRVFVGGFITLFISAVVLGMWVNGMGVTPASALGAPLTLGYPNTLSQHHQYIWGYSFIALISGGVIMLAKNFGPVTTALEWKWIRLFGKASYSGYLWHFPLAHWLSPMIIKVHEVSNAGLIISTLLWLPFYLLILTLVMTLSYRLVERPMLVWRS